MGGRLNNRSREQHSASNGNGHPHSNGNGDLAHEILKSISPTDVNGSGGRLSSNGLCVADKSTEELLQSFRNGGAQIAFEEIVRRYAGMVYSVCLQVTRDAHDAEDATQAAFLTLALRAKTAENIKYLGPWLQKVARRLSLDIIRAKNRRKKREERRSEMNRQLQTDRDPSTGLGRAELADIVRDELGKLPAKYRLPLILHYFGGLRPEEVARELGFKPSTLGVRLHRGRKMLADSLASRGINMSNGMLGAVLATLVLHSVGDNVIASNALAAAGLSHNGGLAGSIISARVIGLTRTAFNATIWAKAKLIITAVVITAAALTGGAQAVRTYAPQLLDWKLFDISRVIRPMLRSFVRQPRASADPLPDAAPLQIPNIDIDTPHPQSVVSSSLSGNAQEVMVTGDPAQRVTVTNASVDIMAERLSLRVESDVAKGSAFFAPAGDLTSRVGDHFETSKEFGGYPAAVASGVPSGLAGFWVDPASRTAVHTGGRQRFPSLIIDSRTGSYETYVMSGNASVGADHAVVGDFGHGRFVQGGGSVHIGGDLVLGRASSGSGSYQLSAGADLRAANQIVGMQGHGEFLQSGGNNTTGNLTIAQAPSSTGAYLMRDGALDATNINVGAGGNGTLEQRGGEIVARPGAPAGDSVASGGTVVIGENKDAHGNYVLSGGRLVADVLVVGKEGHGTFAQSGGTSQVGKINVGQDPTGNGTVLLTGGDMQIRDAGSVVVGNTGSAKVVVGGNGSETANISEQGTGRGGKIDSGGGVELRVRASSIGKGEFSGWGEVALTGDIVQNGVIAADGFGRSRELDLSTARSVTNTIDNPETGGVNGWYARRAGKLTLPPIYIDANRTGTWGEDPNDPIPDLVNSVRITPQNVIQPGAAAISLFASDYEALPPLPDGEQFVGIWGFERDELQFSSGELLIRYDDLLVNRLGGDETLLRLWTFDGDWQLVDGELTFRDPGLNLLRGTIDGDVKLFGVSINDPGVYFSTAVPEPAGALVSVVAIVFISLRRRRHH